MPSAINRKSIGVNAGIKFKLVEISTSIEAMSHTLNCNGRLVIFKILFLLNLGLLFGEDSQKYDSLTLKGV